MVCLGDDNMKGELYRIDKETFAKKVEMQGHFLKKGKEKIAESTANNIKSIRTMHKTHQHMNESISKALVDDVKGEGSNPFQDNQKRDKKIELLYADKEKNGVADREPKSPTLSDRLPAPPSPDRGQAEFSGTANMQQMRKSMAQAGALHSDITNEIGNQTMQRPVTHEGQNRRKVLAPVKTAGTVATNPNFKGLNPMRTNRPILDAQASTFNASTDFMATRNTTRNEKRVQDSSRYM